MHFVCRALTVYCKKMLYYVKVHESEGLDKSEGQDCVSDTKLNSGQGLFCLFYFYHKLNFNYERNICNGCFHCMQYKKANYMMLFRVFHTKKGTFRTVSSYFFVEVEELLGKSDLNERFGWLYKDKRKENEHDEIMEELC